MTTELTRQDRLDHNVDLGIIKRAGEHVVAWYQAIRRVKERGSWRSNRSTWEEFCQLDCGLSAVQIRHMIADLPLLESARCEAGVASGGAPPLPERARRHLKRLPEDQRLDALQVARELAGGQTPTANQLRAEVDRRLDTESNGKPPPPIAAIADGVGQCVTDPRLVAAFQAAADFTAVIDMIIGLKARIKKLREGPAGALLMQFRQQIEQDRLNLKTQIEFARPHAICPYCGGREGADCDGCKGRGWIDKKAYKSSPAAE